MSSSFLWRNRNVGYVKAESTTNLDQLDHLITLWLTERLPEVLYRREACKHWE
jgi:hypothetical protein